MGIEKVVLGLKHCAEDNCTGCPYEKGTSNCLGDLHIQVMQAIEALQWTNKQLIKTEKEKRRELWKKAITEFADRLTERADLIRINAFDSKWAISQDDIDNLVEEMTDHIKE